MPKFKFYHVGSIIVDAHVKYKVIESDSCKNCAFWYEDERTCIADGVPHTWACGPSVRKDGKSVIFVYVGEVK